MFQPLTVWENLEVWDLMQSPVFLAWWDSISGVIYFTQRWLSFPAKVSHVTLTSVSGIGWM